MGYDLDWKHPRTFNEKLQWLKLYNRNPLYTTLVDKYRVKKWVSDRIGEQYIIPTLAVYNSVDEINLDCLPEKFVLKCNHDSGSVVICKNKSSFDLEEAKHKLGLAMKKNFYWETREWPYRGVKKCVFAEKLVKNCSGKEDLPDFKWFCFNGKPRYCQVIQNRSTQETIDFFDIHWGHQPFIGLNPTARFATTLPEKPKSLDTQIHLAHELSKDTPFSRVDLYEVNERVYFGEITFFPMGGFGHFSPIEYDIVLGKDLILPKRKDRKNRDS